MWHLKIICAWIKLENSPVPALFFPANVIKHLLWLAGGCSQKVISGAEGISLSTRLEEDGSGPGSAQCLGKGSALAAGSRAGVLGLAPHGGHCLSSALSCTGSSEPLKGGRSWGWAMGAAPISVPSRGMRMLGASPAPALAPHEGAGAQSSRRVQVITPVPSAGR